MAFAHRTHPLGFFVVEFCSQFKRSLTHSQALGRLAWWYR